jgi:hypothetical protein
MSQTIISDNTTIKLTASVTATRTSTGALYAVPFNGYALVQLSALGTATGTMTFTVDGIPVATATTDTTSGGWSTVFNGQYRPTGYLGFAGTLQGVYVGPNQTLAVTFAGGATGSAYATGVVFTNSPS